MVGQQVDLVHVEHPAVGGRQQPGLEAPTSPPVQGRPQVERPDHPVLGRADRQLHERSQVPGNRLASPRARVDLALPLSPRSSTPPMRRSIALSSNASFACCWPTTAEKGNRSD